MDTLLKIEDLYVEYKTDELVAKAVNGVSLTLNKGETLGLVGETGAGKTTTALSILRLLPGNGRVASGRIEVAGQDILKLPEPQMRLLRGEKMSMIFQDPMTSLNPILTVGDQIAEVIRLHRDLSEEAVQKRVDEMLSLVGIQPERKREYPHQFSGGMKQRVVIAIALACEPELLIADEPTTALDVTIQAQILSLMNQLKREMGTSMILITHDLGVVVRTCDKVSIMYAGEIVESGRTEDIFQGTDHHPYTVGLFGSIPNLWVASRRLRPIDGLMPDPTDLPSGCKFHPRCPQAMEICSTTAPPDYVRGSRTIKCHLFGDAGYAVSVGRGVSVPDSVASVPDGGTGSVLPERGVTLR